MREKTKEVKFRIGDMIYFKDDIEQTRIITKMEKDFHGDYTWLVFLDEKGRENSVPNYRVFAYKPQNKGTFIDTYWHDGDGYGFGGYLSTEKQ